MSGFSRSLDFAKYCLNTCVSQHQKCGRPRLGKVEETFRPTRLIYLHPGSETISLATGDEIPYGVDYVTLSHCWGKPKDGDTEICLRDYNLEQWKIKIPPLYANLKFLHAVDITRRLEFSYLWIDSLCIIQKSESDWQHEAALMSRVYKFAVFNIAAASARNGAQGCYFDDRMKATGGSSYAEHHLEDEPLYKRGWVLQERMLAPRILNCTQRGFNWECGEAVAIESEGEHFLDRKPRIRDARPHFDEFIQPGGIGQSGHAHVSREILLKGLRVWFATVETYMKPDQDPDTGEYKENLTKPSDKLVAISAIARELKPFMHCEYIAGLWEDQLLSQLAWAPGGEGDGWRFGVLHGYARHSEQYRAPSWSWASYCGSIKFPDLDFMTERHFRLDGALVEIINVKAEPVPNGDEFSKLVSASITLRGRVFQLKSAFVDGEREYTFRDSPVGMQVYVDELRMDDEPECTVWCLPIEIRVRGSFHSLRGGSGMIYALLLKKVDHRHFRRVGLMCGRHRGLFQEDPIVTTMGSFRPGSGETGIWEHTVFEPEDLTDVTII